MSSEFELNEEKKLFLQELSGVDSKTIELVRAVLLPPDQREWIILSSCRVWQAIMFFSNINPDKQCFNKLIQPKFLNKILDSNLEPPLNIFAETLLLFYKNKKIIECAIEVGEIRVFNLPQDCPELPISDNVRWMKEALKIQPDRDLTERLISLEDCIKVLEKYILANEAIDDLSCGKSIKLSPIDELKQVIGLDKIKLKDNKRIEKIVEKVLEVLVVEFNLDKYRLPPLKENFYLLLREIDPCLTGSVEKLRKIVRSANLCCFRKRASKEEKQIWDRILDKYHIKR